MPKHRITFQEAERYLRDGHVIRDLKGNRLQSIREIVQTGEIRGVQRTAAFRRPDLENRYFRSAWEANYARYLNFLQRHGTIHRWEYEVDEFEFPVKRGSARFYKPDFKVWMTETHFIYHEVKGHMDQVSATKLKRMQRYYPHYEVIVIDKSRYYQEVYPLRDLLLGWETGERYGI